MTKPVRLQLSRRKGFDLQAHSQSVNGLPAVNVARPGKWGNPYRVDDLHQPWSRITDQRPRAKACVEHYRHMVEKGFVLVPYTILTPEERRDEYRSIGAHKVQEVAAKYLAGKNLACWCKPGDPCHGDVLLELANGGG